MQGYPLYNRTSHVRGAEVMTVSEASTFQVGDSTCISERGRAVSMMRTYPVYSGNELYFKDFTAFTVPIPFPTFTSDTFPKMYYPKSKIYVDKVKLIALAGNSVFHIGSTHSCYLHYRVHQIRDIVKEDEESYTYHKFCEPATQFDILNVDDDPLNPNR